MSKLSTCICASDFLSGVQRRGQTKVPLTTCLFLESSLRYRDKSKQIHIYKLDRGDMAPSLSSLEFCHSLHNMSLG